MSATPKGAVVLLSGGLDSAVCLALTGYTSCLWVDYGQPHSVQERQAADRVRSLGEPLYTAKVNLPLEIDRSDSSMYIPGRNLMLLSLAATMSRLTRRIVIGANADDHDGYPDCRDEFFAAAEPVLGVEIHRPLIRMTKAEIGDLARELGVPIDETWSCYYPAQGEPCGQCDACKHRAKALA
jgi:7-cyano-7-deazaguanine synthase